METSKLLDEIDITTDNGQPEERFSFDSEDNNEDKNLESSLNNSFTLTTILLNKITSTSSIDLDDVIKQLCDPCIESKYTKIIKHKKMTLTICRLQEIYIDL